jgi:acetyltransferase-like isoleucine patch superfamily enzyme
MDNYRSLTLKEINILEDNGCTAEDWTTINVAEDFQPTYIRNVSFYGEINLGVFEKSIEASKDFYKHSGITRATLRNVTVGDNCLIQNIGNHINNYTIGEECYISNVCTMETTEGATFGEGNMISVLNEIGDGNVILFDGLTSQMAALMVKYFGDKEFAKAIRALVHKQIEATRPDRGTIGDRVKIINTSEITNTHINDECEVIGACRLSDCSIKSIPEASVYVGSGVICENSIIFDGSSILNSVKLENCFVGEACQITNGFTAESSVFFANSYMANGEACAAFCGPFTASHHKSSLLIGGMFSFYNAGSATNFSNHAYKMGPLHYGIMERGSKTASGAYLLMPANIGAFSVCFGKLMYHPDTRALPFSYLIAYSDTMYLVPGRNLTTVGLYRDIRKWPKRDVRPREGQKSIVNFDWLSPFTVGEILRGKHILEELRAASGDNVSTYNYHEYVIKASALRNGIKYYDMALRIFMGAVLKRHDIELPKSTSGGGEWTDLSGLLWPVSEEQQLVEEIKNGAVTDIKEVLNRFKTMHEDYPELRWAWAYKMMLDYYGLDTLTEEDAEHIHRDYVTARRFWIAEIRKDAEKEFEQGDVEEETLNNFLQQLDKEINYETWK